MNNLCESASGAELSKTFAQRALTLVQAVYLSTSVSKDAAIVSTLPPATRVLVAATFSPASYTNTSSCETKSPDTYLSAQPVSASNSKPLLTVTTF